MSAFFVLILVACVILILALVIRGANQAAKKQSQLNQNDGSDTGSFQLSGTPGHSRSDGHKSHNSDNDFSGDGGAGDGGGGGGD